MVDNFNRAYKLTIARKSALISKVKNDEVFTAGIQENYLTEERQSLVFTQHQMTADIDYTRKSKNGINGPAKITLSNLSEETLNQIKEEDTVYLEAGYINEVDNLPLLFLGDIEAISTIEKGTELITTIFCRDSRNTITNLRVSGVAPPNTTYGDAIQGLLTFLGNNGLPTGIFHRDPIENILQINTVPNSIISNLNLNGNPTARTLINGRNYEGNALKELQDLVAEVNYEMYISLGKIYVVPKRSLYGSVVRRDTLTIEKRHLKAPVRSKKDSTGSSFKEKGKVGVVINTSLDGRIKTDLLDIELNTDDGYAGTYDVVHVKHTLDYEGGKWDTITSIASR